MTKRKKSKTLGKFGVDTAEKAKEREKAKLIKEQRLKKITMEKAQEEAIRIKNRKKGQLSLGENTLKHFW